MTQQETTALPPIELPDLKRTRDLEQHIAHLTPAQPLEFGLAVSEYISIVYKYFPSPNNTEKKTKAKGLVDFLSVEDIDYHANIYKEELTELGIVALPFLYQFLATENHQPKVHKKGRNYPCSKNFQDARIVVEAITRNHFPEVKARYYAARDLIHQM